MEEPRNGGLNHGHGQADCHRHGGEQLQVIGVHTGLEHQGDNDTVNDCAQANRDQRPLKGAGAEQHLADNQGGQADDNGAGAHLHIREGLVLGNQRPGQGNHPVGNHQPQDNHVGGIDALGAGHVLVVAGGPDGGA